jgi:hypothetical protein
MAEAAAYVMNRMPHPQSKDRRRQVASAHELITGLHPDIFDLIAAPDELVVVNSLGAKASAGRPTGSQCYYKGGQPKLKNLEKNSARANRRELTGACMHFGVFRTC